MLHPHLHLQMHACKKLGRNDKYITWEFLEFLGGERRGEEKREERRKEESRENGKEGKVEEERREGKGGLPTLCIFARQRKYHQPYWR